MRIAAIEAGGTKFVCAVGDENGNIFVREVIKTTTPAETMGLVVEFFKKQDFEKMAVGCFGPIDLNMNSATYGYITSTPKKAWINYNILGELKKHFNVPMAFNTDVNCAALGELVLGTAKNLDSCLYMTVGTGIGAGAVVGGNLVSGMLHPEMGHILIKRREDDDFEGTCIYHKDCFEGLACGKAIDFRWDTPAYELPVDHKAWDLEAYYLAQGIVNFILILSPQKIILGGSVPKQKQLFPMIHNYVKEFLNGYINTKEIDNIEDYIVYTELGDDAGIIGTLVLGSRA